MKANSCRPHSTAGEHVTFVSVAGISTARGKVSYLELSEEAELAIHMPRKN
jgi:hypothetical protein